jgi:hypothetical protein
MSNRTRERIGLACAAVVALAMWVTIIVKVWAVDAYPDLHAMFVRGGIYPLRYWLALACLIFPILMLYRRTSTLGFILVSCYWAGATATVITHGDYQELPPHLLALLTLAICSWFRYPEIWARFHELPVPGSVE